MKLSSLLFFGEYTSSIDTEKIEITEIVFDIQNASPGCLFVCLKGERHNTHLFIPKLLALGVAAILAEENCPFEIAKEAPVFYVKSTRRALAFAWSRFCFAPADQMTMIGITGTNGKTSTAYMLDRALRACGCSTAMIGTLGIYLKGEKIALENTENRKAMTTPDPDILFPFLKKAYESGVTHVIMEVSSHALAQEKVAPIRFQEAIFTNLSAEHLDYHHTLEEYAKTKQTLFLQTDHATINIDDSCGAAFAVSLSCPRATCGILWNAEANASQITETEKGEYSFFYQYKAIKQIVSLSLCGKFQIYNALLSITSAISLGMPAGAVCSAIQQISFIPGRMQLISDKEDDIRVYIDFAHTEKALAEALLSLRSTTKNNLIVLFGCGGERDASKRAPMGYCAMKHADYSIITSDNSRGEDISAIIGDILQGHTDATTRRVIIDREKAIQTAILNASDGDTVLLAGKGHENYEIKHGKMTDFSEEKIAKHALKQRHRANT